MNRYVITIARQYGSDGHKVGKYIAEKLNYKFFDKEIINELSTEFDLDKDYLKNIDEKNPTKIYSVFSPGGTLNSPYGSMYNYILLNDEIMRLQSKMLQEKAEETSLVVVGRCGDYIFRNNPRLIRVFIYCDEEIRAKKLMEEHNVKEKDVKNIIKKSDKNRSNYYFTYTDKKWGESKNYDLCINMAKISIPQAGDLIINYKKNCFGE